MKDGSQPDALFIREGEWYLPSTLTTGPWRPDAMHGGPPAALFGEVIAAATQSDEQVARVGIDLDKAVPLKPLRVSVQRRQISRRVAHLDLELSAEAGLVARATALLLKSEPVEVEPRGDETPREVTGTPGPFSGPVQDDLVLYHRDVIDYSFEKGSFLEPGPARAWLRLTVPVIAGEHPSSLALLLAVADFGSALSSSVVRDSGMGLINLDISLALHRDPVGPWFLLDAAGRVGDKGIGLATTELFDAQGPLGVLTQSQVVHRLARSRS